MASSIAVVVSGQIVVHSESLKSSSVTFPRNERSETGRPNWSDSVNPGAGRPDSAEPGSNEGFNASAFDGDAGRDESPTTSTAASAATPTSAASAGHHFADARRASGADAAGAVPARRTPAPASQRA